jgi:integrase
MPLSLYQRGKVWHFRGSVAGRRLRGSCKTTDKGIAARAVAEIEAREWKCGFDGPGAVLTFAQAALLYRGAGKTARFLDRIEDHFKETLVKDIKAGTIRQMAIDLYPNCGGASRNRMGIVPAQAVINHAAYAELCQPIRVKRFPVASKVKEPATLEWIRAFQAHSSPALGGLAMFMYLTGARVGEAIALQWADVDLTAKTALVRESKVSKERVAHLPDALVVALANIPKVEGRGVFVYQHPDDSVKAWKAAIKAAGIKPLTPHSCRHGFATGLLRKGIDVVTVAKLGGWKTPAQVLKTYGHAIENRKLTDVLMTQNEHADEAISNKPLIKLAENE